MSEIPEIEIQRMVIEAAFVSKDVPEEFKNAKVYTYDVNCGVCGYVDFGIDEDDAEDIKLDHIKWHEEGMQE